MATIVYGVSCGEYSDYEVCAVFADAGQAAAWLEGKKGRWEDCTKPQYGVPVPLPHDSGCQRCRGSGRVFEADDTERYRIEEWPWNPEGKSA
jgi:hypothetical protein